MTPDEMRVRILTLMGWGFSHYIGETPLGFEPGEANPSMTQDLPNYPASLDACAEFEATLTDKDRTAYQNTLAMLCGGLREDDGGQFVNHRDAISATAPQRCEAFLRVKGVIK